MPYALEADRQKVRKNVLSVCTPAELNYLITLTILHTFRGHMKYETIHAIKKDFVIAPKHNRFLRSLVSSLAADFTTDDVYTAAACAYDEFSRRVVSEYEKKKIALNGDMPEYVEILSLIEEMK